MVEIENCLSNFIRMCIDEDFVSGKYVIIYMCFLFELNGFLYIGYVKFICLNFGIV